MDHEESLLLERTRDRIKKLALQLNDFSEEEKLIVLIESLAFKVTVDKYLDPLFGITITNIKNEVIFEEKLYKNEIADRLAFVYYQLFKNEYSLI